MHWCSQQRGTPGIPLENYTVEHIRREFMAPKWCAPYCTIGCVHRVSTMDYWRRPQKSERVKFEVGSQKLEVSEGPRDAGLPDSSNF